MPHVGAGIRNAIRASEHLVVGTIELLDLLFDGLAHGVGDEVGRETNWEGEKS